MIKYWIPLSQKNGIFTFVQYSHIIQSQIIHKFNIHKIYLESNVWFCLNVRKPFYQMLHISLGWMPKKFPNHCIWMYFLNFHLKFEKNSEFSFYNYFDAVTIFFENFQL